MARNGSGTYTKVNTFVAGTTISSSDHNENWDDIAIEITNSVAADGQTTMTGPLKAANGSTASPAFTFGSDTDSGFMRSSANAISLVLGGAVAVDFGADIVFKIPVVLSATATFSSPLVLSATASFTSGFLASATAAFVGEIIASATATFTSVIKSTGTSHILLPNGTTAQRPSSQVAGRARFNSTLGQAEVDDGGTWRPVPIAQPIAAGFKNLVIQNNSATPNSKIDVDADAVTVETDSGVAYRLTSVDVTIDCSTTGANGLDSGSLGNSAWYAVFIIYNPTSNTVAGLASTSASSPTMPSGYTAKARLGWIPTNGSAQFFRILQRGRTTQYVVGASGTTTALRVVASGGGGTYSNSTPTWASVSVSSVVPTTASQIKMLIRNADSSTSVSNIVVAPNGDYGGIMSSSPAPIGMNINNGVAIRADLSLETTNISWAAGSTAAIYCIGWEDNI